MTYKKEYYQKHKEQFLKAQKKYRAKNKEKQKEYYKRYNKSIRNAQLKYYLKNRNKLLEYARKYYLHKKKRLAANQ